jgi:hypothetical protein
VRAEPISEGEIRREIVRGKERGLNFGESLTLQSPPDKIARKTLREKYWENWREWLTDLPNIEEIKGVLTLFSAPWRWMGQQNQTCRLSL